MARKLTKKVGSIKKIVKKPAVVEGSTGVVATAPPQSPITATSHRPSGKYTEGIGRRKVATARVRLYQLPGDFLVNGQVVGQYFASVPHALTFYNQPLKLVDLQGKVSVSATVTGSGLRSQLTAVIHGLARALVEHNPDWKPVLRQRGWLTRDDRMKETRKIGMGGKARRRRQSPKR